MNTGLSGYFSSTQFSSHLSKTVSICLYKLSEQSHLSNVAEQRHTNTGKFPGSTCPSQQGHCFQLTKPMTPFSLSQNRAIGHHQTFSSNAVHLISSKAPTSLRKSQGETCGNGASGALFFSASNFQLCSSFLPSSVSPLHNWMYPCVCTARSLQGTLLFQRCHMWLRVYLWQAQENWWAILDNCWGTSFQETGYQSHLLAQCYTVVL